MRTPDGRLAILDFGLMTQIDSNIKYGMIEAISHLIHRDYEAIVEDFVTLDFIPKGDKVLNEQDRALTLIFGSLLSWVALQVLLRVWVPKTEFIVMFNR